MSKTQQACFKMMNDEVGVTGCKLVRMSLDDAYSSPRTMVAARSLVAQNQSEFIYGIIGCGRCGSDRLVRCEVGEAVTTVMIRTSGARVEPTDLMALVKEDKGTEYATKSVHFVDQQPVIGLGNPDKKALRALLAHLSVTKPTRTRSA